MPWMFAFLLLTGNYAFSQAPNISYPSPQAYMPSTFIQPLSPVNTGGAVPANIYNMVSTFAGGRAPVTFDATGTGAGFNKPSGIAHDAAGNLYVSDFGSGYIRKITPGAVVTSIGNVGTPAGLVVTNTGNIVISDFQDNYIYQINAAGARSILAGNGIQGANDGSGTSASFGIPGGLATDALGNVFVAEQQNNKIRKISPAGMVSTIAGDGTAGNTNGPALSASFNNPDGLVVDNSGDIYVADTKNNLIRKITAAGVVSTFAGNGTAGNADGAGNVASFNYPTSITMDATGNLYVVDNKNQLIRKITPAGIVTTLAGNGTSGSVNGLGTSATFNGPIGITYLAGDLYITDCYNYLIRKIALTGYTIDRALPAGLVFDSATGIITGAATVLSPPTNYTITAYNSSGSSSAVVSIQVAPGGVDLDPIPAKTICDADFDPPGRSIFPITYSSSNLAVATIVSGKIHIVGAGTTSIRAAISTGSTKQALIVTAPPTPVVNIAPDYSSICAGMAVTFTATINSGGGAKPVYQWKLNGANVGANSATYTTTTIAFTDIVECEVTNNDQCTVSGTSNRITGINVLPYITPAISIQATQGLPVCKGAEITFTVNMSNSVGSPAYQWQVNGANVGTTNSSTFTSTSLADGDQVTCTLTSQGGPCLTSLFATSNVVTVSLIPPPDPYPSISISASSNDVYENTTVTFMADIGSTTAGVNYQWQVNNKNVGANNPVFTTNTLKNGDVVTCILATSSGCSISVVSSQITTTVLPLPTMVIPNTFTPNGDSFNDTWDIPGLFYYPGCMVSIYNRNGGLVYQSKGYNEAWNGTLNGRPLPASTYYYIIDLGVKNKKISGNITVLR